MVVRHLYIVSYDISSNRLRATALQIVRGYATGGQKSVHECWLTNGERDDLLADLSYLINLETDRILILRLDPRQKVRTLGCAVQPLHPDFFYIG